MNVKNLLTVNAIIAALLALSNILAPTFVIEQSGADATDLAINLTRVAGALMIGYVATSWLMRSAGPSVARRAFLIGVALGYAVIVAVFILNILTTDLGNAMTWFYIILSALLGIGFIYFAMKEPAGD